MTITLFAMSVPLSTYYSLPLAIAWANAFPSGLFKCWSRVAEKGYVFLTPALSWVIIYEFEALISQWAILWEPLHIRERKFQSNNGRQRRKIYIMKVTLTMTLDTLAPQAFTWTPQRMEWIASHHTARKPPTPRKCLARLGPSRPHLESVWVSMTGHRAFQNPLRKHLPSPSALL